MPPYCTPLGIPWCIPTIHVLSVRYRASCSGPQKRPWAQDGESPWVRASLASQDPKGVTKSVPVCAEFSALSRVNVDKDWIATGPSLLYTLWLGHVRSLYPGFSQRTGREGGSLRRGFNTNLGEREALCAEVSPKDGREAGVPRVYNSGVYTRKGIPGGV